MLFKQRIVIKISIFAANCNVKGEFGLQLAQTNQK